MPAPESVLSAAHEEAALIGGKPVPVDLENSKTSDLKGRRRLSVYIDLYCS